MNKNSTSSLFWHLGRKLQQSQEQIPVVEGVKYAGWASADGCPIEFKPISLLHAPTSYTFYAVIRPEGDHLIGNTLRFSFINYST